MAVSTEPIARIVVQGSVLRAVIRRHPRTAELLSDFSELKLEPFLEP